jgi:hypothetical protein
MTTENLEHDPEKWAPVSRLREARFGADRMTIEIGRREFITLHSGVAARLLIALRRLSAALLALLVPASFAAADIIRWQDMRRDRHEPSLKDQIASARVHPNSPIARALQDIRGELDVIDPDFSAAAAGQV